VKRVLAPTFLFPVADRRLLRWGTLALAVIASIAACDPTSRPVDGPPSAAPSTAATAAATPPPTATSSPDGSIAGSFDVGGRSLVLDCRGTGSPTVIFLVGTGASRTQMRTIEDEALDMGVRVCNYDRAGEGQSETPPASQTDIDVTDDLAKLLAAANVPPPYVLVGQSVGGDQAWLYADQHPAGVAGLLIMNAGFFTLDWDDAKEVWSDQEIAEERAHVEATLGEVKQAATPLEGVPYVVMLSTIAQCDSPTDVCGRIYPLYEDWARELAGRTADGRFVSVAAGHAIFQSQRQTVIDEVRRLINDVR
jgi:hypothetical protein